MANLIEVENLCFSYTDDKKALDNVNIQIKKGEKIAVLGSNGSGKSTFFLNLNGVLRPKSGTIKYKGNTIGYTRKELLNLRKNIGIVFQEVDNQIIAPTVMGEVSFGPMNLKISKKEVEERGSEALEAMDLLNFKNRAPHYLSGGEKKRVTIADILAMKPEIILFDEPSAALDPINCDMLEDTLNNISNQGITMLISTHDVDFAYRWADRIIVFCNGKIICDDIPENVFNNIEILNRANLKAPILLELYKELTINSIIKDEKVFPKTLKEFKKIIEYNKIE